MTKKVTIREIEDRLKYTFTQIMNTVEHVGDHIESKKTDSLLISMDMKNFSGTDLERFRENGFNFVFADWSIYDRYMVRITFTPAENLSEIKI